MNPAVSILADCQRILAAHLPPDSISERACISALLGVLNNPEAVALTLDLAASTAPDMASPGVCAFMSAAPKDITVDGIAEACLMVAQAQDALIKVGIEGGDYSPIHARLEDARELLRGAFKREVNTKEAAEVVRLRSELGDAQAAVGGFARRNAQAEAELMAAQERERRLSERLASIAGLCAGN
jgi:hypothetical protein